MDGMVKAAAEWLASDDSAYEVQPDAALRAAREMLAAAGVGRLRDALAEIQTLGEQGMKPDYREWVTFHDKVAQIAREALEHGN